MSRPPPASGDHQARTKQCLPRFARAQGAPTPEAASTSTASTARPCRTLSAILQRILPGGRRVGGEYVALNPRRVDRHLGSFRANLKRAAGLTSRRATKVATSSAWSPTSRTSRNTKPPRACPKCLALGRADERLRAPDAGRAQRPVRDRRRRQKRQAARSRDRSCARRSTRRRRLRRRSRVGGLSGPTSIANTTARRRSSSSGSNGLIRRRKGGKAKLFRQHSLRGDEFAPEWVAEGFPDSELLPLFNLPEILANPTSPSFWSRAKRRSTPRA